MTSVALSPAEGAGLGLSIPFPAATASVDDSGGRDGATTDERAANRTSGSAPPASRNIPVHPIPSLQAAFTESLDEVTNGSTAERPRLARLDARARREELLGQDRDAPPFDALWRYRPGQTQHELLKLLAQISFGVYLLLDGMANSDAQVISILQSHIDDVDEYVEVALEDLAQAAADLGARVDHLRLPLSNVRAFEALLEDRHFRRGILEANERIDHVLCRTGAAMRQCDDDIAAGLKSTVAFASWLRDQDGAEWRTQRPDVVDVFDAMRGNAEGWLLAFDDVHDRAQEVNGLIVRLTTVVAEMEKKAGEVSRRTWETIPPFSSPLPASRDRTSGSVRSSTQSAPRPWQHQQPGIRCLSPSGSAPATADGAPPHPSSAPSARHAPGDSVDARSFRSRLSARPPAAPDAGSAKDKAEAEADGSSHESLYVLQPRIYSPRTPQPPTFPAASEAADTTPRPAARAHPHDEHAGGSGLSDDPGSSPNRPRASLESAVSDAVNIPPRSVADAPMPRPSSKYATSRSTLSRPLDSAYCTDVDGYSLRRGSHAGSDLSPSPAVRPHMVHSPRSDQNQLFRPVRASPHSPLQQRPHTATAPPATGPPAWQPGGPPRLRRPPSHPGSMSTLSNVTLATDDERSATPTARPSRAGDKPLKKKKSAFGWFKKAFSLDDEERAQFKARRAMAQTDRYYEASSPRFLDGRRIR